MSKRTPGRQSKTSETELPIGVFAVITELFLDQKTAWRGTASFDFRKRLR
jgi:hypothetical protein